MRSPHCSLRFGIHLSPAQKLYFFRAVSIDRLSPIAFPCGIIRFIAWRRSRAFTPNLRYTLSALSIVPVGTRTVRQIHPESSEKCGAREDALYRGGSGNLVEG